MTQAVRARSFTSFCAVQTQMKYNNSGAGNTAYYIGTDVNGTAVLNMLDYLQPGGLNGAGTKGTYAHGSPQRGSGINLIRETNLDDNGGFLEQVWEAWGYLGYKYILGYFYPGNPYGPSSNPRSELGFIDNMISLGYCTWVEGPNEVDNFGPASNGGSYTSPTGGIATGGVTGNEAAAAMQCDAWTFFNGVTVNVAFESFADQTYSSSNPIATALSSDYSSTIGDVANYGNVHGYAVGGYNFGDPSSSANGYGPMSEQITNNAGWEITAGVPVIVTETGFISGNFNSSTQSAGVYDGKYGSDYVNGCYMPQLYLHGFNYRDANGNPLGCLSCYELGDDQPDNGTDQTHYGLFFINQVPKGGAAVLNAFMQIVSDTGVDAASFSPGSLSYTLSGMPSNGESLLLQTSNGTFILCLWANASIYVSGIPTVAGPWNVTVAFGSEQSAVNIFDPNWPGLSNPTSSPPNYGSMTATAKNYNVVGSTAYAANTPQIQPIQAFTNTSSITVSLGDGAIFVVIPSAGGASFAGTSTLAAAGTVLLPGPSATMGGTSALSTTSVSTRVSRSASFTGGSAVSAAFYNTAVTYYVNSATGNDSHAGTSTATAFATLQHAASVATVPGTIVYIMAGNGYNTSTSTQLLVISNSGAAGNPITYTNYPGDAPVLSSSGSAFSVIRQGANYITLNGLTINSTSSGATTGIAVINTAGSFTTGAVIHHNSVTNCTVKNCGDGIWFAVCDYITCIGNTIINCGLRQGNGPSGIHPYSFVNYDTAAGYHNYFIGNTVYNTTDATGTITDGEGFDVDDFQGDQQGLPNYTGGTLIANNLCYNNGSAGILVGASDYVDVIFNTCYNNQLAPPGGKITGEISVEDNGAAVNNINIYNNICYSSASGYQLSISTHSGNANINYDYNCRHGGSASAAAGSKSGNGTHDVTADPLFVNPGTGLPSVQNFALQAGSPCIGAGTATWPYPTDIVGNARGPSYTMGAYQSGAFASSTAFAGAGSLSGAANVPPNLTIIVGTSSLAAAAIESVPAVVVVTGTGAFAASGIPARIGASASFAGAGTMSASAAVDVAVASALAAAGTLSLAPQAPLVLAATAFAGLGAFTATGPPAVLPATSFPAIGTFVGSVVQAKTYSVALPGTGLLGLSGEVAAIAAASLAGAGGLAATAGVVHGAVSLAGSGSFVAAAIVAAKTAAVLSGAGGLAATAAIAVESASVLLGVGKLAVAAGLAGEVASVLSGTGGLAAAAGPARGIALAFPGTGGLAVAAGLAGEVALAFPGIGGLAVAAGPARGIALAFPGIGGVAVAAGLAGEVVSILSGIGGLAVAAGPARGIALAFPGIGGLAVAAGLAGEVASILSGIGGLAAAASPAKEIVAALAGTGGLVATARVAEAAGGMFLGVGALSALALPPIAGGIVGMASVGALVAAVEANLVLAGASLAGSAMIFPVPISVVSAFPFIGIGGLVAVGLVPHLPQDVQVGFTLLPPGHPHAVGRHRFHR